MRRPKSPVQGLSPSAHFERLETRQLMCSGALGLFINAGGGAYLDAAQNSWDADADSGFTGGSVATTPFTVRGTAEQGLYNTRHIGTNFSVNDETDSGGYTLTLMFADPVMTKPGMRIFNVFAEGKEILKNFDLVAASGPKMAYSLSFPVTITDDELNLQFQAVKDNAIISAIELVPLPIAPAQPSEVSATANASSAITVNWTDNANNESGFEIDRSPDGKTNWQNVGSVSTDAESFVDTTVTPGTKYFYRVQSIGQYGQSPFTVPVNAQAWGVSIAPAISTLAASATSLSLNATPAVTPVTPAAVTTISKITWTQLTGAAQSPVGRTEAETATVNGKIYCFGGYTDSTLVPGAVSDVFDPTQGAAGTWTPLPNMPVGTTHAGTTTDGRYIYMAGGYTPGPKGNGGAGNQTFANPNVYRFDTQTNTWSTIQPLPAARGAGTLVLLNGTLHFIGGTDLARKDQTTHWSLDLSNPNATWQTQTSMLTARNHLGGVVLNGKIYVVAGQENQDPNFTTIGNVEIWDPANPGVWTTGAPLPVTRSHIAGATFVYGGQIIVMGGDHTYLHDVSNVSAYDPIANKWSDLSPLPIGRESGCGTVINNVFYYMTGNISKACYKGVLTLSNPVTQPATPANQDAVANSTTQIKVTWSAASGATSYAIYRNTTGSTTFTGLPFVVQDTGAASYSYLDNSVSPSTQYFYEVLAVNRGGNSPAPATLQSATTFPVAPTGFAFSAITSDEIDLTWNAVNGANSYLLQSSPTGLPGSWNDVNTITPSGNTTETYADQNLSSLTAYFYQISVTTGVGTSTFGTPINTITAPALPTGLQITNTTSTEVDLSWTAIPSITNYLLQRSTTGLANSWSNITTINPSGNATETYSDLGAPGPAQYFYRFAVTTSAGVSAPTDSVNTNVPVTIPTAPTNFTVSNVQSNQVTLNWSEASTAITGFTITRSTDDATWTNPVNVGNVSTTNITGLSASTPYYFQIIANNTTVSSTPTTSSLITTPSASVATTVIVDDKAATLVGAWTSGNTTAGFFGTDYLSDGNTAKGTKTATFTPNLTAAGNYQVFARWTAATSRATNVPFDVLSASGTNTVTENQQFNGGTWVSLGTFQFNGGTAGKVTIRTTATNGYVIADAVEFVPVGGGGATPTTVIVDDTTATKVGAWTSGNTTSGFNGVDYLSDGNTGKGTKSVTFTPNLTAGGTYNVYAKWTAAASRATNVPMDIVHQGTTTTVTVNQQQNGGVWFLLGTFTFDAGLTSSVTIRTTGTNGYVIADAIEFVPA